MIAKHRYRATGELSMHVTLMLPAVYCPSCISPFSIASLGAGPTAGIVFASAAFICASLLVVYITRWVVMVERRRGREKDGGWDGDGRERGSKAAYRIPVSPER